MIIWENGIYREATEEEIEKYNAIAAELTAKFTGEEQ
jgi:hypothetical protein